MLFWLQKLAEGLPGPKEATIVPAGMPTVKIPKDLPSNSPKKSLRSRSHSIRQNAGMRASAMRHVQVWQGHRCFAFENKQKDSVFEFLIQGGA